MLCLLTSGPRDLERTNSKKYAKKGEVLQPQSKLPILRKGNEQHTHQQRNGDHTNILYPFYELLVYCRKMLFEHKHIYCHRSLESQYYVSFLNRGTY